MMLVIAVSMRRIPPPPKEEEEEEEQPVELPPLPTRKYDYQFKSC
jgi:hypothetical protein